MKSSKIFALPSDREGFGTVIVEALACGCKVIALEGSITEELKSLVIPASKENFNYKLEMLLKNKNNKVFYDNVYSTNVVGRKLLSYYKEVIEYESSNFS